MIPFNKPYLQGKELLYIADAIRTGKIGGDGMYTKKVHEFLCKKYKFNKVLLTTSCTDALEMASILLNISIGDEVIVPAYTFVSTANAFILRGATLVFADSEETTPNIDASRIETLITNRTKAIVIVHYAGIACDMGKIMAVARRHDIPVIEDAAQAIDSYYKEKPLGSIGIMGAFSFHETKNIISGEGGLLCINDPSLELRAEIIREKGTNRSAFFRGEVDKYGWVDIGSSFLPSDIIAACLLAQLESIEQIQSRRLTIWNLYHQRLVLLAEKTNKFKIQYIPEYATNNAHMFYLVCDSLETRTGLISHLKLNGVLAVFHYLSLHKSAYFKDKHEKRVLENCDRYADCLIRLPLYYELTDNQVHEVCDHIFNFFL